MQALRLAIIGVGTMGAVHARNLLDGKVAGVSLAAVCDVDPAARAAFPTVPQFADAEALFASGVAEAVLIATPHYDHTTLSVAAFAAGLHVLVEKPLGVHVADCQKTITAWERRPNQKQVFAEMFNQRTDPLYRKLRSLITSGELGAIRRIQWTITDWFRSEAYYRSGGWRATWGGEGGGVLLNQCPHQLDLWQWLFGMPEKIRAFCHLGKYHNIEVEDEVTAYMEYANGATGVFIASTGEAPGTNRLEIAAERGRVVIEGGGRIQWIRNETPTSDFCASTPERFSRPSIWQVDIPVGGGSGPQHNGIIENFAAHIRGKADLIGPGQEGINSVALANAMLLSSATGQTVNLPLDAATYAKHLQMLIDNSTYVKPALVASSSDMSNSFGR